MGFGTAGFTTDPSYLGYDLILCLGQSNMEGRATLDSQIEVTDPHVWVYPATGDHANQIILAQEPLSHLAGPINMGPATTFGRWYAQATAPNRRTLLVAASKGGTSFSVNQGLPRWDSAVRNELYDTALTQARGALVAAGENSRYSAVLWIQGESDFSNGVSGATYQTFLDAMITQLRIDLDIPEVPFVVGQMNPDGNVAFGRQDIDAVHLNTPARQAYTGFAYGVVGHNIGDNNHYDAYGQRAMGRALFKAYRRAAANVPESPPVIPTGLFGVQTNTSLLVTWDQPFGRVTGFNLRYRVVGDTTWNNVSPDGLVVGINLTGLTKGFNYEIQIQSESDTNGGSLSPWSASYQFPMAVNPGQVVGLATGTASATTMPLSWTSLASATYYQIEYRLTGAGSWTTGPTTTNTFYLLQSLVYNSSYDFRVTAYNGAGAGTPSATSVASTIALGYVFADTSSTIWRGYGLRKLRSAYAGSAIRVRRSSDNTEQDIGFTGAGDLNVTALTTFVGGGNGFVVTWYDQSTNAFNLTQATVAKQPQIVSSGTVLRHGLLNLPTVEFGFDGLFAASNGDIFKDTHLGIAASGHYTIWLVGTATAGSGLRIVTEDSNVSTGVPSYDPVSVQTSGKVSGFIRTDSNATLLATNAAGVSEVFADDTQRQLTVTDNGSIITYYVNRGTGFATTYNRGVGTITVTHFAIGGRPLNTETAFYDGGLSEVVISLDSVSDADRQAVSQNQKDYYGIT